MSKFTYEELELLNRIAVHLGQAKRQNTALNQVLDWLKESHYERGVITLADRTGNATQAEIVTSGISDRIAEKMLYKQGEGVTGQVYQEGKPVFHERIAEIEDFLDRSGLRRGLDLTQIAFFCLPLIYHDRVIGTLSVDCHHTHHDDLEHVMIFLLEVARLIAPFVQYSRLQESFELFSSARSTHGAFGRLIGRSSAMDEVRKLAAKVADASTTVLINGETGTGKGVIAEIIHELSPRKKHPFVEVNCGAIPENLIESELFGHEKGAFTGAIQSRQGVFERAAGGTVFLDEIGELPLALQTRLLRVLQTRRYEKVGGTKTLTLNARVICATNKDLEKEIEEGTFRQDLYFRVSVFPLTMPSLRTRGKADVMLLVDHFTQQFSQAMGVEINRIDSPAIDMLTAYHWPGNVRELENVIERAVLLADGSVIHGHHLPPSLQMNRYSVRKEVIGDFKSRVESFEQEMITEALKDARGNQSQAAKLLGLTQRIMQYKVQKYKIDYRQFR